MSKCHCNIKIVSIEGNIGSGKSTLLENLRKYYGNNSYIIFLKEHFIIYLMIYNLIFNYKKMYNLFALENSKI